MYTSSVICDKFTASIATTTATTTTATAATSGYMPSRYGFGE
jgi:hypothetical protein